MTVSVSAAAKADGAMQAAAHLGVLVGLARTCRETPRLSLNLLPEEIGNEAVARRRQRWLVAAVVVLGLALLPALRHFHREAKAAGDELVRVQDELGHLRGLQTKNEANLQEIAALRGQIVVMRQLVESKTNWVEFLGGLQECLGQVEDVWLERLQLVSESGEFESEGAQPRQRLALSGRLLDVRNPQAKVSPDAHRRVQELLDRFKTIPFVEEVERERFDSNHPGILHFDCTLVLERTKPL